MKNPNNNPEKQKGRPTRIMSGIEGHFQGKVLAGLLELVPLLVTAIVVLFIVGKTDSYVRDLPFVKEEPWDVPGIGLAAFVVALYVIGLLISFRLGKWVISLIGVVLLRIPVIKVIYRLMLQVTNVVASDYGFSRVVFIEWPRDGMVALGFVTGRVQSKDREHSLVTVYIPTIPNPTSGNMAFVNEDDVMETDISVDSAMKLVFSGGFVLPDTLAIARVPRTDTDTDADADFLGAFEADNSARDGENQQRDSASKGESGAPAVGGLMPKGTESGKSS